MTFIVGAGTVFGAVQKGGYGYRTSELPARITARHENFPFSRFLSETVEKLYKYFITDYRGCKGESEHLFYINVSCYIAKN